MGVQKTPIDLAMSLPTTASVSAKGHFPVPLYERNYMENPALADAFKVFRPPSLVGIADAIWDLRGFLIAPSLCRDSVPADKADACHYPHYRADGRLRQASDRKRRSGWCELL
jgi:hypothetical protein